ncbi:MAG: response regulator [Methylibium sp.]|nr:response regulator [Methylibium sp.]
MAGRIVLWSAEPADPSLLEAAEFAAQAAGASFEQADDASAAIERVKAVATPLEPCLLVMVPLVPAQLQPALRPLSSAAPDARCLFVMASEQHAALRRALTFLAPPGGHWHIERSGDPELGQRMADALGAIVQKGRLRTTLDRMKVRLSAVAPIDPLEHRRLMAADLFFSTVLRQASDAIVSTDDRGVVQSWNAGAAKMFGLSESEAIGSQLATLFEDASSASRLFILAAGGASGRLELLAEVAGVCKNIDATADGIRDERGRPIGAVAILRDVTEQRRAQQDLVEAARQKDEFLAMLAHELRNPLSPIRGAAQILRLIDTSGDPRMRKATDIISRQVDHLTGLVDDLLDVARVTRGAVDLDKRPVVLRDVVESAVEQARSFSEAKYQQLDSQGDLSLYVLGDAERLIQVVANLLNNAVKYTSERGKIALNVRADDATVRITVADNGAGIAPDLLPHLFQLFSQGRRTVDRSQGGLGIGLALVKTLVELHGGSVSAQSPGPQLGSTFTVTLPRIEAPATEPVPPKSFDIHPFAAGNRLRLMVVDDNADAATTLAGVLEAQGHVVDVNHDPVDALARAPEVAPDAFILDIGMPVMDGYELARRLRGLPVGHRAVIIALTGYGQPEDRLRSRHAGFDYHLVKPLDADLLASVLGQISPMTRH